MYSTQKTPHLPIETPTHHTHTPHKEVRHLPTIRHESGELCQQYPDAACGIPTPIFAVSGMGTDKSRDCDEARWLRAGPNLAKKTDLCPGEGFGFLSYSSSLNFRRPESLK